MNYDAFRMSYEACNKAMFLKCSMGFQVMVTLRWQQDGNELQQRDEYR